MINLPFPSGAKILEIGCGDNPARHDKLWHTLDSRPFPCVDIVHDVNILPLPVESESYDGIFCMYLIEHLSWRKVRVFIGECHRILKPGGLSIFLTANLLEQARKLVETPEWNDVLPCMIFGDQNYEGGDWIFNAHHCGFSPAYAIKLFKEAGFHEVTIFEHPNCKTDMIIQAKKSGAKIERALNIGHLNRDIFESPNYWCGELGYRPGPDGIGYQDFPIHQVKVKHILARQPRGKLLDIGCAFGYIVKRLRDKGIDAWGIDISQYALSRAPEEAKPYLKHGSADNLPWPDKYFDMVVTFGVLEHLASEILPKAVSEIKRVASRGIIAVTPGDDPYFDNDITHQTKQPLSWWRTQFPADFEVRSDANEGWIMRRQL